MRQPVQPTELECALVREWTSHNSIPKLQQSLGKSKIGTYMTIARVYRHEHTQNKQEIQTYEGNN